MIKQLALAIIICLLWVADAAAVKPSVVNISVGKVGNLLIMDAKLIDAFTRNLSEAVDSGVPLTFNYQIELRKTISFWKDSLVSETTVANTVRYNALKKVYQVTSVGKNVKRNFVTKDKKRYKTLMETLEKIPLASVYRVDTNDKFYIRVKANLVKDRFWFPFNHLFFFVPFNNFKTSWAESSPLKIPGDEESELAAHPQQPGSTGKKKVFKDVIRSFHQ